MIDANSMEEVDLRASTLVASEHIRKVAEAELGSSVKAAVLDYFLWRKAVELDTAGKLGPFHRTRTISY